MDFSKENILLQYLAPYVDGITRASWVASNQWRLAPTGYK